MLTDRNNKPFSFPLSIIKYLNYALSKVDISFAHKK